MKSVLIFLLILQAVALAGPVCGTHLTVAESMDCCEKGHNRDGDGMRDDHATTCCSTCDIGKVQILKQQIAFQAVLVSTEEFIPVQTLDPVAFQIESFHQFISPSPPDIFLADRSFRI